MKKEEYALRLGDNLKKYRLGKGYTQKQFAKMAGVSDLTYMKYEKGRVAVPAYKVVRIVSRAGALSDLGSVLPIVKI